MCFLQHMMSHYDYQTQLKSEKEITVQLLNYTMASTCPWAETPEEISRAPPYSTSPPITGQPLIEAVVVQRKSHQ